MSDYKETKQLKYIVCQVEKILFRDDNTGRIIMSVVKNDGKHTRLLGKTSKVVVGSVLKATGSWSKDEKYGWQFNAEFIQVVSADPLADESLYLECRISKVKIIKRETGFATAIAVTDEGNSLRLRGHIAKIHENASIGIYGKWWYSQNYGQELQVLLWEYKHEGFSTSLQLAYDFVKSIQDTATIEVIEINTIDVDFKQDHIVLPYSSGVQETVQLEGSFNLNAAEHKILSRLLPKIKIRRFCSGLIVCNLSEWQEAFVSAFCIACVTRAGRHGLLKHINTINLKHTEAFLPEEKNCYISFFSECHAINTYPIIPAKDTLGGCTNEGALFTLIAYEKIFFIVWEPFNEDYPTVVFSGLSDYENTLKLIIDFIYTQPVDKYSFLRMARGPLSKELFNTDPFILPHTSFEEWKDRLTSYLGVYEYQLDKSYGSRAFRFDTCEDYEGMAKFRLEVDHGWEEDTYWLKGKVKKARDLKERKKLMYRAAQIIKRKEENNDATPNTGNK